MKLLIISHTEHYVADDGTVVGWGPTVTEINHLTELFEEITHLGMLHLETPPPSALPYTSSNIRFVALPPLGGKAFWDKIKLLLKAPKVLQVIKKELKQVDLFQMRTPTGIGVYTIPYLTWFVKTPGWFKYAGNWNQEHPPFGYRIQRFLLKNQKRPVTINGSWTNQHNHCQSFENPCLTLAELELGEQLIKTKSIEGKLNLCYVGRLETPKGVGRFLEALNLLEEPNKQRIGVVHLVGDGPERKTFEFQAKETGVKVIFHGFLPRQKVFEIYKQCQAFVMPTTASEGFPKVLSEAMNFGCLPIVTNISAIGHYIQNNQQGILLDRGISEELVNALTSLFNIHQNEYLELLINQRSLVAKFTFKHYNDKIRTKILSKLF